MLRLVWYHVRIAFSWLLVVPPVALTVVVVAITIIVPSREYSHNLTMILEGGLPIVAALVGSSLVINECESRTVWLAATRVSLRGVAVLRTALISAYLVVCCLIMLVATAYLWRQHLVWTILLPGAGRAIGFVALGLLAAAWSRSAVLGYLAPTAMWLGILMFGALLPRSEPWLTLNPLAWSAGYPPDVVQRSILVYAVGGAVLFIAQLLLLRTERLLRQA